ncbi:aminoacyl--tRNA ligase-related protein [Streptomyces sp. NBC_00459]|uniref:aminoacyl--tRNA ligase-related protein n=1 Tax=Streptomyces sp. NBC_00459 TaxID=2975749 RepID=UPI002E186EA7
MAPPTSADPAARARGGLATLGPDAVALRAELETLFTSWAADCGAEARLYPPLTRVEDLHRIDYFQNFPQLAIAGSGLRPEALERQGKEPAVAAADLLDAEYAMPSAACYNVYFDLAGTEIAEPLKVTTVATCFRREDHYDGLRRLLGFSMREIVCVGDRESVLGHLDEFKTRMVTYFADLGLPIDVEAASDPFFDASGARALMSQLFPTKEEFVFGGSLAIASVNFHRNFFGERCDLRLPDGSPAFTGCVAFGIERWISALTTHFDMTPQELREHVGQR